MDFIKIQEKLDRKTGMYTISPRFIVHHSNDILIKGKAFYAIYDEAKGLWSTDEYDVVRLVDNEIAKYREDKYGSVAGIDILQMKYYDTGLYEKYKKFISQSPTSDVQLDSNLTFANTEVKKEDHVSKRLPYSLESGDYSAFDKLISTLYEPEERQKIEWAIGCIVSGDSKDIQKFLVLYGDAGSGKSTILNIIEDLFTGYCATFNAKDLGSSSSSFSTAAFKNNPLVAIQHDGDLSKIEDNTKLNSIISHEYITINEKYQAGYPMKVNSFLFMGTNKPVKITDAKSGIIRRLIDVHPSGVKLTPKEYQACMTQIQFELGAIAQHCLDVYRDLGKHYYDAYVPLDMMYKTDVFFNFVEDSYLIFEKENGTTLKAAYALYKEYCENTGLPTKMPQYKFREELKDYFDVFYERTMIDGKQIRSYYSGFRIDKFKEKELKKDTEDHQSWLSLDCSDSIFDKECADYPAQYGNEEEFPAKKWDKVGTKLKDLNTSKLHYVRMLDISHIIVDFDLKDENGNKSLERNMEAASQWPPTYAETSKSGSGIHLHYIYDGDPTKLCNVYAPDIEIKVYSGKSALRRKLIKCNSLPIAHISSGLPTKKGDKMVNFDTVKDEKHLRALVAKNLRKEIHPSTKSSIDFIKKILDDAYASGLKYDISDMKQAVLNFAVNSTHNSEWCVKMVKEMQFKSEEATDNSDDYANDNIVFYDVEVFPNLFLINYKFRGHKGPCIRMINPTPQEVEEFLKYKLVGFNCRRYDNHMLYARMMGYSIEQLFNLSQAIVNGERNAMFSSAYNLSYTDVYDFCAKKQSLKKWEIEMSNKANDPKSEMSDDLRDLLKTIKHHELGLPWDQPVAEELWPKVAEYCDDDVFATEACFEYNYEDFEARETLAEIAGGCPNDTNNMLSGKLIFGNDRNPQREFIYTDLSTGVSVDMDGNKTYNEFNKFEGYKFDHGKSTYKGIEVGEGGCVIADPGMYTKVKTFDVASMHPHTIIALNLFGKVYTIRFKDLVDARIAIKHRDVEALKTLFGGAFAKFANASKEVLNKLAKALKIVINSVYGLTAAHFPNLFRDERNIDNIVAKRGALFMVNLKEEVEKLGAHVVHIKTDSIKIDNPTPEVEQFIYDYGKKYGYTFEIESEYEKMCLVNNAVYIAFEKNEGWTATGTQFAVPFVFKTLFTHEDISFSDLCQTIACSSGGELYLDFNESLPEGEHDYQFIGKVGQFCPIVTGKSGGELFRVKDDKYYAAAGTKGYRWLESERVRQEIKGNTLKDFGELIDISYYQRLADEAKETINEFGDFDKFVA